MKKYFVVLVACAFWGFSSCTSSGRRYELPDVGYISIPDEMEPREPGLYDRNVKQEQKKATDKYGIEVAKNRIVFQQKGLTAMTEESFSTYARVIINTYIGDKGDFEKLTTKFMLTESELKEISIELLHEIKQLPYYGTGLKIIRWDGCSVVEVNGRTTLHYSFLRRGYNDGPNVVVNEYRFFNNDRFHTLTLVYRQQEEKKWKPMYEKILKSFTITNIR